MCNGRYHFVFQFSLSIPAVRVSLSGLLEYHSGVKSYCNYFFLRQTALASTYLTALSTRFLTSVAVQLWLRIPWNLRMTLGTIFTLPGITVSRKTCPSLNPYIKDVYQRLFFS